MTHLMTPNLAKLTPRNGSKRIRLNDLDESTSSINDDIDFNMQPVSSFQYFKNQEIPVFNYDMMTNNFTDEQTSESVWNDYVDFKLKLNDNGNDKVSLTVFLNSKKHLEVPCSMFLPVFDTTKIMVAGSGSATYIKQIKIIQTEQVASTPDQNNQSLFGINNQKNMKPREHLECCSLF